MGFLRFLSSLRTLAKNGDITIRDAYKFAQQEFGEVSDLLKLQINKIFKDADAPSIKKPENKNNVFTFVPKDKLRPAQMEEATGIESLKNPYRAAGPLDPVEGMTRTAARVVLDRKGIKVPERGDPIDVFEENFGGDALMDLRQAGEELVEKEQMGRITESMGEFLESRGLFDLKVDKTLPKGMTDEELLKKLMDEDPEEFAKGGRVGYDDGGLGSLPKGLQKDTTTGEGANIFNMYAEKPEKSFKEDLEFIKKLKGGVGTNTILYMVKEAMDKALERGEITKEKHTEMLMPFFGEASERITEKMYNEDMGNYATGGRVGFQIGGPAYDATDPIYGSSTITVTPDTIMGPKGNQIQAQSGVNPNLQRRKNPFENLGFLNISKHFDQNQLLKDAVKTGEITPEQYNELGGYDVTQTMGAGNPVMGGIGNLLGSTAYNVVQSLKGDQSPFDIPGDVYRNVKGGMGFISDDLKSKYENIINRQPEQPFLGRPVESITTQPASLPAYDHTKYMRGFAGNFISNEDYDKLSPEDQFIFQTRKDPRFQQSTNQLPIEGSVEEATNFIKSLGLSSFDDYKYGPYRFKIDDNGSVTYLGSNYATGGRVGYAYGSGVKLIQLLQKAGKSLKDEIKKAVDDLIPSGDPKLDADMAVDNMLEDLNINRDTLDEYDILDAYGMAYDELKKPLLANIKNKPDSLSPKLIERFELKQKYPGIDEELVTKIVDDPDPQRKAEVLATIEQAFELMKQGRSSDEVLDIMKQMTDRTKQAGGGLSYLSGF